MKTFLIPGMMILAGLGLGVAGGVVLRPAGQTATATETAVPTQTGPGGAQTEVGSHAAAAEYLKLPNQFVVPVVVNGQVASLVVISLSLEVVPGNNEAVFAREPKLRDEILRLFFDHANSGGFSGSFTDAASLSTLRRNLVEVAQAVLGPVVTDVLITDIMRQDS